MVMVVTCRRLDVLNLIVDRVVATLELIDIAGDLQNRTLIARVLRPTI